MAISYALANETVIKDEFAILINTLKTYLQILQDDNTKRNERNIHKTFP